MIQYKDRDVFLIVQLGEQLLHFTAHVLDVSETHIRFEDKFGVVNSFRLIDVIQIKEIQRNGGDYEQAKTSRDC